jgi:pyridoxine 5-phosphate synthase
MTHLSVNINKVALLRNSRGRNFPDVVAFSARCLDHGAAGITLHPRPDQRHARYSDVDELKALCSERGVELNVEGFPTEEFLDVVVRARPAQCTLVPDAPGQLTSDHGWQIVEQADALRPVIARLRDAGVRVSLFVDFDYPAIAAARELGADRVELYTEPYAVAFGTAEQDHTVAAFARAARVAQEAGLGVNAGHDLSLDNLGAFVTGVPGVLEVSIGHALIAECLYLGLPEVMRRYQQILQG